MIGRRFGRYRVVSRLGQGGLATVWKANDELLGRAVALKLLHEHLVHSSKARRRFLHEAQTAAALDHPGIVAVHDAGECEEQVYIALALIDGETVSERVGRRLLPFDEAVRIASAAAGALDHAHTRGVIHRDVTGRNIMVSRDGRVLVLDFGLALAAWESRITTTDTPMGTASYMASEVIRGRGADARSDVYGLGVVLYEMLTGTFPFTGEKVESVFYAAVNLPPAPPRTRRPDLPDALEQVVLRAIARDPEARHQTAAELLEALCGLELGESATPPPRPRSSERGSASGATTVAAPDAPTRDAGPRYVAVLPFEVAPGTQDPDGACAALAGRLGETLGCALANAPGVRVVAATSGPLPTAAADIARELGANQLLRGSVRRQGMQLRVTYALVDPWSGVSIAGDVVDGPALQPFEVEDQVLASVVAKLGIDAHPRELRGSRAHDAAAHEHFQQALGYLRRYDNEASVDGAIGLLERLVDSEAEVAAYHAALARAYLHKHQLTRERVWESRAAAACERARSLDAGAPEVRLAIGLVRLNAGQHVAALAEFEAALALAPDSYDALLGKARALADGGDLAGAERMSEEAIARQPDDWRGHSMLGWVRLREHRFGDAVVPWQRVVELTPDNARGRRNLGTALYRLDRFAEAVEAYRASLAIQPSDEAFSNLGTALYALGRYDEAITAFRTAVALTPGDPVRWGNLGIACRWVSGHEVESAAPLERAIGLMRERLERNPSRADWWALLAQWLAERGRLDDARATIRRAIELDPEEVVVMLRAGDVYYRLGERAESLGWFRAAKRSGCGMALLRTSPALAALRADPDFVQILNDGPGAAGDRDPPQAGMSA